MRNTAPSQSLDTGFACWSASICGGRHPALGWTGPLAKAAHSSTPAVHTSDPHAGVFVASRMQTLESFRFSTHRGLAAHQTAWKMVSLGSNSPTIRSSSAIDHNHGTHVVEAQPQDAERSWLLALLSAVHAMCLSGVSASPDNDEGLPCNRHAHFEQIIRQPRRVIAITCHCVDGCPGLKAALIEWVLGTIATTPSRDTCIVPAFNACCGFGDSFGQRPAILLRRIPFPL